MSFYTSVHRMGNNILFRGYDNKGNLMEKRVKYKPTLYLPSKSSNTEFKSLDGRPVEPKKFDSMKEAGDFVKSFEDMVNFKWYGMTNYVYQFIAELYPDNIEYNLNMLRIGNVDIEVASDDGFPEPDEAKHPVISIAYKDNKSKTYYVWGLGDYDPSKCEVDLHGGRVRYVKCGSEGELLQKFVIFIENNRPDVLTGWNITLFDVPYLVNRITKICGEKTTKALSPWGIIRERAVRMNNKELQAFEIYGLAQMDYLDLFKKFGYVYGTQESYALDHIGHVILGERKLSYEEYGSLHSLYKENHQKFIDYNVRDVDLVDRIDQETGLLELALVVAYKGGVNYPDAFGTTGIWDSIIYRFLNWRNIVVPPQERKHKTDYPGGYVKEPRIGISDWIASFDLNSLYPNLIVQYNMSPETLLNGPGDRYVSGVDYYLDNRPPQEAFDRNVSVAANGSCYSKEKRGFLPEIIIDLYDERKAVKKEMIGVKQEYESNKTAEIKRKMNQLDNMQQAVKILLNSLYGALGNQYFRYFELAMAEGITLSGQLSIRWAERVMNQALNKVLKLKDADHVIAIDTDSIYVCMEPLVKAVNPSDPIKFMDRACEEKFVPILAKGYDDLYKHMNAFDSRMVMAREVLADRAAWRGKKQYIVNVHNNEGVQYAEPKLKVMGLESVKSSTPQIVRDKFKKAYKIILTGSEEELQRFVSDFAEEFRKLPPHEVSFPRGVSEIDKWKDPVTLYKKGCPIHVRGSILFNDQAKKAGLDKTMELIKNGSKVKFCYMKLPNPVRENAFAFPTYLPEELQLGEYIDYDKQFEKSFKEPLKIITDAIDWRLEKIATLEGLFG